MVSAVQLEIPKIDRQQMDGLHSYVQRLARLRGFSVVGGDCDGASDKVISIRCVLSEPSDGFCGDDGHNEFSISRVDGILVVEAARLRGVFYAIKYIVDELVLNDWQYPDTLTDKACIANRFGMRLGMPQCGLGYRDPEYNEEHFHYMMDIGCTGLLIPYLFQSGISQLGRSTVYPEMQRFVPHGELDDTELTRILQLSAKYDMDTYISLCDPHLVDTAVCQEYPDIELTPIQQWTRKYSMCLSSGSVMEHYRQCVIDLFTRHRHLTGLHLFTGDGGAYLCNAGDRDEKDNMFRRDGECPRCTDPLASRRSDFINMVHEAITSVNSDGRLIYQVWYDLVDIDDTIGRLDRDIIVAGRFEEGAEQRIDGQKMGTLSDTTMAVLGPGSYFTHIAELCKKNGIAFVAQFAMCSGNLFDFLPSTIAPTRIADKALAIDESGVFGWLSYDHGINDCPNCAAFGQQSWLRPDNDSNLAAGSIERTALTRYGSKVETESVVRAWQFASEAVSQFPFAKQWWVRALSSTAFVWAPMPGVMKLNGNGQWSEPLLDVFLNRALIAENIDLYCHCFDRMRALYQRAYECFEKGVGAGNDTAAADLSELYYSASCATSASNLFRFLRHVLEICNMRDCSSRSELATKLMAIASDELAGTARLVERITEDDTFYIWWHCKIKKITKDILVRKAAMLDRYCLPEAFENWGKKRYSKLKEIQIAYERYVEQMPREPVCNTVD